MNSTSALGFAVLGGGGFAHFAVSEFVKHAGVRFVGVYDTAPGNAEHFKTINPQINLYSSEKALMDDKSVDLVYIATPPFLHYGQSKAALLAGKHVICEKPAALNAPEAEELLNLSRDSKLLYVVNLMQRYNPLFDAVKKIVEENVLGSFLRGYFENYASDEFLTEGHWFWDETKSGGIFIEHGVHFFDLFSGWLGPGKVISSQKLKRHGHDLVDKVHATVLFKGGLVNFYHGFDQPKVLDRQEMRLQFERGEITLFEWVPTRLVMNAICNEEEIKVLRDIFPGAAVALEDHSPVVKKARGNFKDIYFHTRLHLDTGEKMNKESVYRNLLSAMLDDQLRWVANHQHTRKITGDNAVSSLVMAETSDKQSVLIGWK